MTKYLILLPLILYVSYCLSAFLCNTVETQVHGWYLERNTGEKGETADRQILVHVVSFGEEMTGNEQDP